MGNRANYQFSMARSIADNADASLLFRRDAKGKPPQLN
jgi:hypothetical protein